MPVATLDAPERVGTPLAPPPSEQRLELGGMNWERYIRVADAVPDHAGARMTYLDGSLTFVTTSRRHDALSECLSDLVKIVAVGIGVNWAVAGRATFRREDKRTGVEGDQTFYFGAHASRMRGNINVDLKTQPPPDLAIEVEVSNPAEMSILAWSRIGVPEVWWFHVDSWTLTFLALQEDGTYLPVTRSLALPTLTPEDVADQLRRSEEMDTSPWYQALSTWVRDVLVPRQAGGG